MDASHSLATQTTSFWSKYPHAIGVPCHLRHDEMANPSISLLLLLSVGCHISCMHWMLMEEAQGYLPLQEIRLAIGLIELKQRRSEEQQTFSPSKSSDIYQIDRYVSITRSANCLTSYITFEADWGTKIRRLKMHDSKKSVSPSHPQTSRVSSFVNHSQALPANIAPG